MTDAFPQYVRARSPAVQRTAFLLTGDQHRAEDLVQEALIRTYRAWDRLHSGNPDAYTRTVMYHQNISWHRRRRHREVSTGEPPEPPPRTDGEQLAADRIALRAALARLAARQRAVIVLRFFEDATEAEAAEVLGITVGTVKSQTAKALARLRAIAPGLLDAEEVRR